MNVIYPNLDKKLKENGLTYADLAKELCLPDDTLSQKIEGLLNWRLAEVICICRLLQESDAKFLFCTVR